MSKAPAQYGEPWRVTDTRVMSGDNEILVEGHDERRPEMFRATICVNACVGVPDYAMGLVQALIAAVARCGLAERADNTRAMIDAHDTIAVVRARLGKILAQQVPA